jgi:SWI/SNF-related matrix-associated actin-dependent regulator of chromatin subfamily A-like protein 1
MAELYAYQKEDASKLSVMDTALLASDAGTGKTATMIQAVEEFLDWKIPTFVIVVCPAVARGVWAKEWRQWAKPGWTIIRINKGEDIEKIRVIQKPKRDTVVIVSYDQFSRREGPKKAQISPVAEAFKELDLQAANVLMIADESHYLKGFGSNRTNSVYDLWKTLGGYIWLASATPAPNNYGELYPMIANLWPEELVARGLETKEKFEDHFCIVKTMWINGRELRTISGSKNGKELKDLLSQHMIRRKKADVLKDLPEMIFDTLPIEAPASHIADALQKAETQLEGVLDDELLNIIAMQPPHLATIRRETGMAKVAKCAEWVRELLDPDPAKKVVIFAYHTEVLNAMFNALAEFYPVKIDGRTLAGVRDRAVEDFQTGRSRVFIGQIVAAGTAITLTAASDVLFVESDWVPANNYQAASRCHRIGQKSSVIARHAVLEGSLDERIGAALVRKERELAEIFG